MTYDPTRELLADWAAIMRQLRARDIVRTWGVITRWIATAGAIGALASTRKGKRRIAAPPIELCSWMSRAADRTHAHTLLVMDSADLWSEPCLDRPLVCSARARDVGLRHEQVSKVARRVGRLVRTRAPGRRPPARARSNRTPAASAVVRSEDQRRGPVSPGDFRDGQQPVRLVAARQDHRSLPLDAA